MNSKRKKTKKVTEDEKKNEKETLKESSSATAEKKVDTDESIKIEETEEKERAKKGDIKDKLIALNEKYLRLLAEYDNYRKRSIREIEVLYQTATEDLIKELLPILDNLDLATEHRNDKTTLRNMQKA